MMLNSKSVFSAVLSLALTLTTYPQFSSAFDRDISSNKISQNTDRTGEIEQLKKEANDLFKAGKYRETIPKLDRLVRLYQSNGDRRGEAEMLHNLGVIFKFLEEYPKANDYFQKSLAIYREVRDRASEAYTLLNLGTLFYDVSDYPKASIYYQQSLVIYQKLRDRRGEVESLYGLGLSHLGIAKYQQALTYYQQALVIYQELRDRHSESRLLNSIGMIYRYLGRYQKAIEYYQKSNIISKEIGDRSLTANTLNNMGDAHRNLGKYQAAIEYHQQALTIERERGDRQSIAVILNNLGLAYEQISQYQKTIEYYQQSLALRREIGDRRGEGTTLHNLGSVYNNLGRYQLAIEYYQQALIIRQKYNDRHGEGATFNGLGLAYYSLDQYPQAISSHQQALSITKEIGDRNLEGAALGNLGLSYHRLKDYQKAIDYYQSSLKIQLGIGDLHGAGSSLNNIGFAYKDLKKYQQAITYYQKSIQIRQEIGDALGQGHALTNQAYLFYELRQLSQAEASLRRAITTWESIKAGLQDRDKISFGDTVVNSYKLLQKVLVEQGKAQAALEISERARARALAELLASKVNILNSSAQTKIRQAPNLNKIQQIAKQKNTTLVQYSLVDEAIFIWVISPTGKISFKQSKLPPNTNIQDLVIATRDSVGANRGRKRSKNDAKSPVKSDLKQLYQLLIAPIATDLPQDPNALVTILPQDQLAIVPFAALQDAKGEYLIDKHTINIAPSIQVLGLTETTNNSRSNRSPLVVGNPIYPKMPDGTILDNLTGAETEAQSIGQVLNTQPLIGAAADKKEVIKRMQGANLIHLATHGFFIRVEGELPGAVALTNGFLTSDEIFDMQLQADLVVLSACDTGRGQITGDGVVGLSRSLVVAGVPSVMVSLWEVDDKATKVLMEEFYSQLWVKKLPKAQAMRQAMLKTKEQFEDPNLWGAFMLVGEAR